MLIVVYVTYLTRNSDTFLVRCANLTIVDQRFESGLADLRVDEIAADHDAGAALTSLAMNSYYVFWGSC